MATVRRLESAFKVYFDEMKRCQKLGLHWALLHVVVSLPDICAALEAQNGQATGGRYRNWCRRFAPRGLLTGADYYDIRNLVLHQGRTRTRAGRFYTFTKPGKAGTAKISAHRTRPRPDVVVLDVSEFADEIVKGIRAWFADLQRQPAQARRANVVKNLPSLVTVTEQALPVNARPLLGITSSLSTFGTTGTSTGT